jgi:hypothetical protein
MQDSALAKQTFYLLSKALSLFCFSYFSNWVSFICPGLNYDPPTCDETSTPQCPGFYMLGVVLLTAEDVLELWSSQSLPPS